MSSVPQLKTEKLSTYAALRVKQYEPHDVRQLTNMYKMTTSQILCSHQTAVIPQPNNPTITAR